jgi:hypothetical protein
MGSGTAGGRRRAKTQQRTCEWAMRWCGKCYMQTNVIGRRTLAVAASERERHYDCVVSEEVGRRWDTSVCMHADSFFGFLLCVCVHHDLCRMHCAAIAVSASEWERHYDCVVSEEVRRRWDTSVCMHADSVFGFLLCVCAHHDLCRVHCAAAMRNVIY